MLAGVQVVAVIFLIPIARIMEIATTATTMVGVSIPITTPTRDLRLRTARIMTVTSIARRVLTGSNFGISGTNIQQWRK